MLELRTGRCLKFPSLPGTDFRTSAGQLVYDFWALAGIFPCDISRWAYALEPVHSFSSAYRYQRLDGRLFTWLGASYPVGLITTNEWGVDGTKAAQCVGAPGLPFIAPLPRTHAGGFVADYISPIGPQLSSHTDSRIHRALLFSAEAWPNPMPVLSRYLRDRFGLPSTFHLHSALVAVGHSSHPGYGRGPFPSLSSRPSLPIDCASRFALERIRPRLSGCSSALLGGILSSPKIRKPSARANLRLVSALNTRIRGMYLLSAPTLQPLIVGVPQVQPSLSERHVDPLRHAFDWPLAGGYRNILSAR